MTPTPKTKTVKCDICNPSKKPKDYLILCGKHSVGYNTGNVKDTWIERFETTFKHSQFVDYSKIRAFISQELSLARQSVLDEAINSLPEEETDAVDWNSYRSEAIKKLEALKK